MSALPRHTHPLLEEPVSLCSCTMGALAPLDVQLAASVGVVKLLPIHAPFAQRPKVKLDAPASRHDAFPMLYSSSGLRAACKQRHIPAERRAQCSNGALVRALNATTPAIAFV
jgi:hypothetical protein